MTGHGSTDLLGHAIGGLCSIQGLVLDMDGVLWHGMTPLPGLGSFFNLIEGRNLNYVLATNNPSMRPEGFAEKARGMGLDVSVDRIINSAVATVHYLQSRYARGTCIHVIGEAALKELIAEAGFVLADEDVKAVVVALERGLTYETFKRGTLLIRGGAQFIGTNADPSYPTEEGILPGSGMMVVALRATTDVEPIIMGKPERGVFDLAVERLSLSPAEIVSVGDRLDTDIAGGNRYGMKTILLLSGIANLEDVANSSLKPDWVFQGLPELTQALKDCAGT